MLLPTGINVPLYYRPIGAVLVVVLSLVVSIAAWLSPFDLIKATGNSPALLELVLALFAYPGPIALLFSCLALWLVGLAVEGKVGFRKFITCYFLLGYAALLLQKLLAGPTDPPYATALVFGLLGMAAVWAPLNEIDFTWYLFFGRHSTEFSAPIAMVAIVYVGLTAMLGWASAEPLLCVLTTLLGAGLASAMHLGKLVDCENADIFSVLTGKYSPWSTDPDKENLEWNAKRQEELAVKKKELVEGAAEQLRVYLKNNNGLAALKLLDKLNNEGHALELSPGELSPLIRLLHQAGKFRESAPYMAQLIELHDGPEIDAVRLKLAQICVVELGRPGRALDLLGDIDQQALRPEHARLAEKVFAKARQMQQTGEVELDDDQW